MEIINTKERLSSSKKNANDKAYYKEQANILDGLHYDVDRGYSGVSEFKKMKVNYDLFNNILDTADFEYVCKPYGSQMGELPASMVNRDISSGKIKAMLGMEMKRPFSWNIVATNPEATTRREQEESKRIRDYVIAETMKPIRQQLEMKKAQENLGRELTPEEQERIMQEIEQELQAQTPQEVKKYMQREHQDPAEVMSTQLLNYLIQKCDIKRKFNNTFKHGLLSAMGIMYVGILNGEPEAWNVNSMRFNCDKSPELDFVEDGDWATCEYPMTPSQIVRYFGDELKDSDLDIIYTSWYGGRGYGNEEDLFSIDERTRDYDDNSTIKVVHCVWKALRKLGFLYYNDKDGVEQMSIVDESYKLNKDFGDIRIEWYWIPEVNQTWKIKVSDPIYVKMGPIEGQFKDLDNLYYSKLPYYGSIYDNMNSEPTSLMDRLKVYQYYYNIVMYRLELLLASDKGKKVLMNIGSVPASAGIDVEKWQYFFEATPFMYFDPQEEGSNYADANTIAKVIDLSMASDIQKYIEIAEYLRKQAGQSVGITDQVEGQIGSSDAVSNTRQNLVQSSHILEMYFELHNYTKRNVLQALLEMSKIAYADSKPRKLSYVLDDMSLQMFDLDIGLLDNSTLGLFVANSTKAEEAKETIRQLTHAAMQNQTVELSDIISVIRQESIIEAEETLKVAEQDRREYQQKAQQEEIKARADEAEKAREFVREEWANNKEEIILKEGERRKTVIAQSAITGMSFNPDSDTDGDGINDFLEIAKYGVDAEIKREKQLLERQQFEHDKEVDNKKLKNDEKKIENDGKKIALQKAKNAQSSVK